MLQFLLMGGGDEKRSMIKLVFFFLILENKLNENSFI